MKNLSICLALLLSASTVSSFVTPSYTKAVSSSSSWVILNAKKNKKGSSGKGFGKEPVVEKPPPQPQEGTMPAMMGEEGSMLSSVAGGSRAKPQIDPNVPVEDRTANILRDTYGLRTREEQDEQVRKQEAVRAQQKKLAEWKVKADDGEDFDIMTVLPGPVLLGIDTFLKAGVVICTTLFVLAGLGITVEAWSKASDSPLPADIDLFIVNTIEPNFTPGLLVLLGFSVSLGAFATAQLSSASSTYREDR
jgi:hypothetical protein